MRVILFSFFVYLGYLTLKMMDKDTQLFQYNLDWKTFQRVLYYTKKYYGMDALYFYEANPFKREEEFVLICFRQATEFFVRDETIAKYIEPIAEDEKEVLFWVFRCIDWAFIRAELKEQAEGESFEDCIDVGEYYHQAMRKELLGLYLFCKETPVRPKMTNEITLTINKGVTAKSLFRITAIGCCVPLYCITAKNI